MNIHVECQAQTTGNHMMDASNSVPGILIIQQTKMRDKGGKYVGSSATNGPPDTLTPVKFPNNTVNILSSEYYS